MVEDDLDLDEFVDALDRGALERVAAALGISEEKRGDAVLRLKQAVRATVETHLRDRWRETTFDDGADREALKRIASAAQKLAAKIDKCSMGAGLILDRAWPKDAISPDEFLNALDALADIATPKAGKAGRPSSYGAFGLLVSWLTGIAGEYDGRASIKANEQKGRLVDALDILRNLLPFNIVPAALPYGSIAKWKDDRSRIRRRLTIKNGSKITRL